LGAQDKQENNRSMDKKITKQQSFLSVLIIWSVLIVLSILSYRYRIYLVPTNILGPMGLYVLIWLPGLFVLGKYIATGLIESKKPIRLVPLIIIFGACLYEVMGFFALSEDTNCYSVSRESLTINYQCVCREQYVESSFVYFYEDCQFSGLAFPPLVRKLPLVFRRWGVIEPEISSQADFNKLDLKGEPFDIEYPSQLIIANPRNVQIGYINFQFAESTNTFDISFVADVVCSKYYTDPISIKNAGIISVKLCEKEYKFKLTNDNGNFTVETQE
jgi:hypothetical protein